jgi:hypothetical protein
MTMKPRVRVKADTLMLGSGVPEDARPGDLVIGNRGDTAEVVRPRSQFGGLCKVLTLDYVGNIMDYGSRPNVMARNPFCRVYDFR